jgi:hypothetical protein
MTRRATTCFLLLGLLAMLDAGHVGAREPQASRPTHVVYIVLGGGVRAADVLDPTLMPNVAAMAKAGRVVTGIESGAKDAYGAAARLLTGRDDGLGGATLGRPSAPTLAEYLRQARDLPRTQAWLVSHRGGGHLALAASTHERFGPALGPATAHGAGAFAGPLSGLLEKLGRPLPLSPGAWGQLRKLRTLSRGVASVWLPASVDAGLPRAEAVERALLRELDRKALLVEGPGPNDVRAFRAARTVLEIHRPALTVLLLGEAEQGQVAYDRYRAVLQANDAWIGRLGKTVAAIDAMAGRTAFVVVTDRGRNEKPDAAGALGEDDDSKQRRHAVLVADGPGILARGAIRGPKRLEDVCATLGRLLGVKTPHADGRPWDGLVSP